MLTRREFIRTAALFALAPHVFAQREKEIWVNDVHSQLNRTRVRELLRPRTRDELAEIVRSASRKGLPISVSGYRHSMGGQRSEEHTSELQSLTNLVCRLLLEKKKK